MTFKERRYECAACGEAVKALAWDTDAAPLHCDAPMGETSLSGDRAPSVIDDQLEGGARWCETMDVEPVWLDGTKSQWRREVAKRPIRNVVRHESDYYARSRKRHDEELRDTGRNTEY